MEYENVCIECGKPFKTYDEDMNYCGDCWENVVLKSMEYETTDIGDIKDTEDKA